MQSVKQPLTFPIDVEYLVLDFITGFASFPDSGESDELLIEQANGSTTQIHATSISSSSLSPESGKLANPVMKSTFDISN